MTIDGFLRRFKTGDSVHDVCDAQNQNRIANILEDIDGVGGVEIWKPTDAEGRGWKIGLSIDPHAFSAPEPEPRDNEVKLPDDDDPDADWDPFDPESGDYGKGLAVTIQSLEYEEYDGLYIHDWVFHYDRNGKLWKVENKGRRLLFGVTKEMP